MSVVPIFRCQQCGEAGHPVDLEWDGKKVGTFRACDACIAKCATRATPR